MSTVVEKAHELLVEGRVGIRFTDGWRTRAFVTDGAQLVTVKYLDGRWTCSCCGRSDCPHVAAVSRVVKVL